ncbi:MAG: hypothetical protein NVSMB17_01570 [Candidatus Dormibacteria bacterium]
MISRALLDTRTYALTRPFRLGLNALLASRTNLPSHYTKRAEVLRCGRHYGLRTLVETGTYLGDMTWSAQPHFDQVFSIELDPALAARAAALFARNPKVQILAGDSAILLPGLLAGLDHPALFWLDAHFSGGITAGADQASPILTEISQVLAHHDRHVVLVDDARLFDGTDGYPTIARMEQVVAAAPSNRVLTRRGDLLLVAPPN